MTTPPSIPPAVAEWFYADLANQPQGPVDQDALIKLLRNGEIHPHSLVWKPDMANWARFDEVLPEILQPLFAESADTAPPPAEAEIAHAPQASEQPEAPENAPESPLAVVVPESPEAPAQAPEQAPPTTAVTLTPEATTPATEPQPEPKTAQAAATAYSAPPPPPAALPPKKNKGCLIALIVVIVLGLLAIPVIGILAAIAIPAYQDFTLRAQVANTIATLQPYQSTVANFYAEHGRCPVNGEADIPERDAFPESNITDVYVGIDTDEDQYECIIAPTLTGFGNSKLDNEELWLAYDADNGEWLCGSTVADRYLPSSCKN